MASATSVAEAPTVRPRPALPPPNPIEASRGIYRDKIRVAWAPVDGAEGYQVWRQRRDASEQPALLIEVLRDAQFYDDFLTGNSICEYWIKARNAAGVSDFSRPAQGWRKTLEAPASLFVSDRNYPDRIYIYWTPVPEAASYELWRQRLRFFAEPVKDNVGISEEWMQRNALPNDDAKQMAVITETAMEDTFVETNVAYAYCVRARDAYGGLSPFTPWHQGSIRPISATLKPPAWVKATAGEFPDRIRITWELVPGQQYEVLRSTINHMGTCRSINWGSRTGVHEDLDVVPDQVYYYWIRTGDGGQSLSLFSPVAAGYVAKPESN
jgi:hypothetical protein